MRIKNTIILILLLLITGCTNSKFTRSYPSGLQVTGNCERPYSKNVDIIDNNKEAVPCAIEPPGYPKLAATKGIEGYVKLKFDILTDGKATNIKLLEAVPEGVFEWGARKALKNWIFRVSSEDGKPILQKEMIYTMEFQLGR